MLIALVQGLIYVWLLPPWQHYDEPAHFEYVWLIAQLGRLPDSSDSDPEMRRAIVESMVAHDFYWNLVEPDLNARNLSPGYLQLGNPPAYYVLASLPLFFMHDWPIESQLYAARLVSLLLFVATVGIAAALVRELRPSGHPLVWAVPLSMALLPPFVDSMTAVNNDAGAVFAASLLLWGLVRLLRRGLSWSGVLWVAGAAVLAVWTKNVAAVLVVLLPPVLLLAWWRRGVSVLRPKARWLLASSLATGGVLLVAVVGWGDAAYWYRWIGAADQVIPTQMHHSAAPVGEHVLVLELEPGLRERRLLQPVLEEQVAQLAGNTITVGGWLWASRPARVLLPGVAASARPGEAFETASRRVRVTTEPTFVAWTYTVPAQTRSLHYVFSGAPPVVRAHRCASFWMARCWLLVTFQQMRHRSLMTPRHAGRLGREALYQSAAQCLGRTILAASASMDWYCTRRAGIAGLGPHASANACCAVRC
ncbi:MAG: DUF2142 domain-containing protein [Chloroflexaceae bacterium]|nr:DUF2142 domain-containing protein [Chloroflexaceae bacterium]